MRRALKWAVYGVGGLLAGAVIALALGFAASEAMIRWPAGKAEGVARASSDPGAIARGRRLSVLNGCQDCHGRGFEGNLFHDEPLLLRAFAPNLKLAVGRWTDAQLDAAIRQGVSRDGRQLWVMPSNAFAHMSDEEVGDLLAYMRTFPPSGPAQPRMQFGPVARLGILLGKFRSEPAAIRRDRGKSPVDLGPQHAVGRSLARLCIECHGVALEGGDAVNGPDLAVAGAYSREDFERLLRTGAPPDGRDLGLMSIVSRSGRFSALTSEEAGALHRYLQARSIRASRLAEAGAAAP